MEKFPTEVYNRIDRTILDLAADPHPPGCRKLQGEDGWRIRVGDYRILYEIDEDERTVTVFQAGHRRDVYR